MKVSSVPCPARMVQAAEVRRHFTGASAAALTKRHIPGRLGTALDVVFERPCSGYTKEGGNVTLPDDVQRRDLVQVEPGALAHRPPHHAEGHLAGRYTVSNTLQPSAKPCSRCTLAAVTTSSSSVVEGRCNRLNVCTHR